MKKLIAFVLCLVAGMCPFPVNSDAVSIDSVMMSDYALISIKVLSGDNPVEGAVVRVFTVAGQLYKEGITDENGFYEVSLGDGAYVIMAHGKNAMGVGRVIVKDGKSNYIILKIHIS